MKVQLERPVVAERAQVRSPLDVRHVLIGGCGTHSLKANGIFLVAKALADEQIANGDSSRLILLSEANSHIPDGDSEPRLERVALDGPKLLSYRVGLAGGVISRLTEGASPSTLFHIHAARQPLLVALAHGLRKRGIPYVVTVHGRYSHLSEATQHGRRRISALYLSTLERWALEGARFVQAVSPEEQAIIRRLAPKARIELVPNAAFSSRTLAAGRGRTAPSRRFPVFGYLGRYEIEHKGLDLLLAGFAGYRRAGGRGTLELVGSGPARADLQARAAALSLQDCVKIDGPRWGDAKLETFAGWDYFCAPSRFEGLPLAVLEAAVHGLPLIVTAETGLQRLMLDAHAGVPIQGLDAGKVTDALLAAERIIAPHWVAMSASAVQMALRIGDWTEIEARLAALYRAA